METLFYGLASVLKEVYLDCLIKFKPLSQIFSSPITVLNWRNK